MLKIQILLADDDPVLRKLLPYQLAPFGLDLQTVGNGQELFIALGETDYDVVLLDVNMPDVHGVDALKQIKQIEDAPEVIMLTSDNTLSTGLEAMKLGAYDYITKPADPEHLQAVILRAEEKRRIIRQNVRLRATVKRQSESQEPEIIYSSAAMKELVAQAERAAKLDTTILITGESGTGKDVLARFIHSKSERAESPLIAVNCGALPESLFESEFFGHERGAFTGASGQRIGLIESADGSTLFLDEIGDMPLPTQVKLLHFLENGRFRRVGSTKEKKTDVRIVAATNRDLEDDINDGRFRADLFYRINVISLHVPPLRERREDIPTLVEHFFSRYRARFNRPLLTLSANAQQQLYTYDWHGNIRELRNCIERAVVLAGEDVIDSIQFSSKQKPQQQTEVQRITQTKQSLLPLDEIERQHIMHVLAESGGNREKAATILGITARTLYRKLQEYGAKE
jgi:DNA-binding NtrC family response regulator